MNSGRTDMMSSGCSFASYTRRRNSICLFCKTESAYPYVMSISGFYSEYANAFIEINDIGIRAHSMYVEFKVFHGLLLNSSGRAPIIQDRRLILFSFSVSIHCSYHSSKSSNDIEWSTMYLSSSISMT